MPKARQGPYKALTAINLPFIEKSILPGEMIEASDLEEAQQGEAEIAALIESGAIGGEDDELDPSTIIPDPSIPTIQSVVAQAQTAVAEMEEAGEEVPAEIQAVANMDFKAVTSGEEGSSSDSTG
jgi:hypothetical protein